MNLVQAGTGGSPVRVRGTNAADTDGPSARPYPWRTWLVFGLIALTGCERKSTALSGATPASNPPAAAASAGAGASAVAAVPVVATYGYQVVDVRPHDPGAFTQGLVFLQGVLFESTGLNGHSSLRRVDLQTGRVLQKIDVSAQYFAEGMTILDGKIYQLTWQSQKGFVYDLETFALKREFTYTGEGWGLTTDGHSLIMSDGTNQIRFLDPATFRVTRTIQVLDHGAPLPRLNELEYVKGEIYANIWQTQSVARINPADGTVTGMIDFSGLLAPSDYRTNTDVLNGIAYDPAGDRLFVTGKNWPKLFEVRLHPK
jgi:glutamine cyclotransferase